MAASYRFSLFLILSFCLLILASCNPSPIQNVYRTERRFPGGYDVPVAFLSSEFGGQPRTMASGWLIDGSERILFSAKHFTDDLMDEVIELGGSDCKAFLAGRVYSCIILQVPPLRDAVIMKMIGLPDQPELPKPYKITDRKVELGDRVFIQGFHPHPTKITESNEKDGIKDLLVPIFKNFYRDRTADPYEKIEVSFDSLEAIVVDLNAHITINNQENDPLSELKYKNNEYIKVVTLRNHKFSFGGLSGGVMVRLNEDGEPEAVGIVTAERPVRFESDKKDQTDSEPEVKKAIFDTILVTPIYSVKDLYERAKTIR